MTMSAIEELHLEIEELIMGEILDETIGFSRLFKNMLIAHSKNWSAKAYSLVQGVPVEEFDGDLSIELGMDTVKTHREMTIRGDDWQVELHSCNTLNFEGESHLVGSVDLKITPSEDLDVLREIQHTLEEMIEDL